MTGEHRTEGDLQGRRQFLRRVGTLGVAGVATIVGMPMAGSAATRRPSAKVAKSDAPRFCYVFCAPKNCGPTAGCPTNGHRFNCVGYGSCSGQQFDYCANRACASFCLQTAPC
jgi:hypothetical protein